MASGKKQYFLTILLILSFLSAPIALAQYFKKYINFIHADPTIPGKYEEYKYANRIGSIETHESCPKRSITQAIFAGKQCNKAIINMHSVCKPININESVYQYSDYLKCDDFLLGYMNRNLSGDAIFRETHLSNIQGRVLNSCNRNSSFENMHQDINVIEFEDEVLSKQSCNDGLVFDSIKNYEDRLPLNDCEIWGRYHREDIPYAEMGVNVLKAACPIMSITTENDSGLVFNHCCPSPPGTSASLIACNIDGKKVGLGIAKNGGDMLLKDAFDECP